MEPQEYFKSQLKDPDFVKSYGADRAQMELALALAEARNELGITQKSMAEKLGVSQPYIAKLEKGRATPTIRQVGSMLAQVDLRPIIKMAPLVADNTVTTTGVANLYNNASIGSSSEWLKPFVQWTWYGGQKNFVAGTLITIPRVIAMQTEILGWMAATRDPHDIENTVPIWLREGSAAGVE
jgi:transcriptional regulator with XRE-family HTH domain